MAQFLTTHTGAAEIENLIVRARANLVLVSPFLKLSQLFVERLRDAARREVRITVVYGKTDIAPEQRAYLARLAGLRLFFLPNLHAKCYFNEATMVITSMNMYEFSEKSNREMGVLLNVGEPAYHEAVREVDSMISAATAEYLNAPNSAIRQVSQSRDTGSGRASASRRRGSCIRCGRRIPLDADRPLCVEDYDVWAIYGNADYPENCCHGCGREYQTSMRRPLCHDCFRVSAVR